MIKTDNESLQITLKKSDIQTLNKINESLNKRFSFKLTKSQVIQYLINNFEPSNKPIQKESKKPLTKPIEQTNQKQTEKTESKPIIIDSVITDYQRKTNALKKRLNLSNPKMSKALGINEGNLKHYLYGQRTPKGKNAEILQEFFEKYGIK